MATSFNRLRLTRAAVIAAMLFLAGNASQAQVAQAVAAGSIPPGQARIWFYRDYEPFVSHNIASVDLNGARVASVAPYGGTVYRDVVPGHYRITPESWGTDINQSKEVDLAPGQEIFAKILADSAWASSGDRTSFERDTFYIRLIPADMARAQIFGNR